MIAPTSRSRSTEEAVRLGRNRFSWKGLMATEFYRNRWAMATESDLLSQESYNIKPGIEGVMAIPSPPVGRRSG